jgi:hypothetical protein
MGGYIDVLDQGSNAYAYKQDPVLIRKAVCQIELLEAGVKKLTRIRKQAARSENMPIHSLGAHHRQGKVVFWSNHLSSTCE